MLLIMGNHRLHGQFFALGNGGRPVGARVDDPVNTPAYLTAELRHTWKKTMTNC